MKVKNKVDWGESYMKPSIVAVVKAQIASAIAKSTLGVPEGKKNPLPKPDGRWSDREQS